MLLEYQIVLLYPIFHPLKKIDTAEDYNSKLIEKLIKNDITLFSAHTNLDFTKDGVSFQLAKKLGLINQKFLLNLSTNQNKLSVFVPFDYADKVAAAMHAAGAGTIGEYSNCSFRTFGTGTFKGSGKSNPTLGVKGNLEKVEEVKIEVLVNSFDLQKIIAEMKKAHPYEEVAYDVSQGLRAIEGDLDLNEELPFFLDGVRTIPAGAISASAEWLVEALRDEMSAYLQEDDAAYSEPSSSEDNSNEKNPHETNQPDKRMTGPDAWVSLAALALVCGHTTIVTDSIANKLAETTLSNKSTMESAQAFMVQTVSQILDTARDMGGITESALKAYPAFVSEIASMEDSRLMLKRAMRVLGKVHGNDSKPVPAYLPILVQKLHKSYKDDFSLSGFAKEHHVAASTVTRALECRINATFSEYLGRIRIEKAQQLLRDTQLSATTIGKRVGITDQSNFGKLFRQYTGINPGAYRERFQRKQKG